VPIQALTVRDSKDLQNKPGEKNKAALVATASAGAGKKDKEELQGVFVVRGGKAEFVWWKPAFPGRRTLKCSAA
jgi:hypothetical protein